MCSSCRCRPCANGAPAGPPRADAAQNDKTPPRACVAGLQKKPGACPFHVATEPERVGTGRPAVPPYLAARSAAHSADDPPPTWFDSTILVSPTGGPDIPLLLREGPGRVY
jgi:hypothetical protein